MHETATCTILRRAPVGYNRAMQIDEPHHLLTPYELAGGEPAARRLVDRFYDLMDEDPDFYAIRQLHPPMLDGSREKLFKFLMGWLGGPPVYEQEVGHPRLRARHLPFAIASNERDQWMVHELAPQARGRIHLQWCQREHRATVCGLYALSGQRKPEC